ncbi:MAG TPA: MBOAT family protein [Anaerolineales bacterium]|nr:MBOAT family protein [Anaerolineales bacterium]
MLFNSYGFIFLFLPAVLLVFFGLARLSRDFSTAWLTAASLFFYGYWNPSYVGLLLGSVLGNYTFGIWIAGARSNQDAAKSKVLMVAAISANLLLLGYYKYANFFLDNINSAASLHLSLGTIVLPLGISFFTFTQIAFLVDTWQGKVKEYNFLHYVLFVTYFPHLIAGPVLHHAEMMPQFARRVIYRANWNNIATGLMLFTLGLCKKTLWADSFAPFANAVFDGVDRNEIPTIYEAWSGALAYTMQIYFDFSGYTDMALGIALMCNIRLPINFYSPYKATSIIEFWRRWHMTLSRFLRDYLYIPLGGNRKGPVRRYANLMGTMLLGGLWHGAGWTFVCWGGLHGLYLTVNHLWRGWLEGRHLRWSRGGLYSIVGGLITFIAVVVAWVVFRSSDLPHALVMIRAMFGEEARPISLWEVLHGQLLLSTNLRGRELVNLLVASLAWVWLLPNSTQIRFIKGGYALALAQAIMVAFFLAFAVDKLGNYSPFLYFQF